MSLKKVKIISFFVVLALCFLFHFLYDWMPNFIFSVLFPVNESIWEHMKLLYSGFIIWSLIEYQILKHYKIKFNNYFQQLFLISITSILIYLIIYLPLNQLFGEVMFINIALLVLVIGLQEIFSYYLLKEKRKKYILEKIAIPLILLFYVVFGALTYNPIKSFIFYDTHHKKYGIDIKE